jgi:hypothetical protein
MSLYPSPAPTRPSLRDGHPPHAFAGEGLKRDYANTRQRNSGDSGGGASSGVQPVNFSIA